MNRRFILVSMLAAAMFATSCSKDENNDKEINKPQVEVQKTCPITIKATNKSGISKVALGNYEENSGAYTFQFQVGETMTITTPIENGEQSYTLTLVDGAGTNEGTFSGEINEDDYGKEFTASITKNELSGVSGAYSSLEEAVNNNYKFVSSEFTLTDETTITLQDQYVYIGLYIQYLDGKTLKVNGTDVQLPSSLEEGTGTWVAFSSDNLSIPDLNLSTTVARGNYYQITRTNAQKPTAATPTIDNSTFDIASATTINLSNAAITDAMEYYDGITWHDVTTNGEINGLDDLVQIKIRVKGNDYLNASNTVTVHIPVIQNTNNYDAMQQTPVYFLEGDTWGTAASYTVNSSSISVNEDGHIVNETTNNKLKWMDFNGLSTVSSTEEIKVYGQSNGTYMWGN